MSIAELEEFRSFITKHSIDDLGPTREEDGNFKFYSHYEYLHLKKEGGRRVMITLAPTPRLRDKPYDNLIRLFHRVMRSGEFKTR